MQTRFKFFVILDFTTNCHTETLSEASNIESEKDISCLRTQNDKLLDKIPCIFTENVYI